jgi:hypothetical protein
MKKNTSPSPKKTLKKPKKQKKETLDIIDDIQIENISVEDIQGEIFGDIQDTFVVEENKPTVISAPVDTTEVKKKIKPKDRVHYVNSKEFEDEIRNYYNTGNITIKLGESLNKIANGLSYAPNFLNYSYKDEMVGDAIVKMFSALKNKKFKIDCGFSPFSYFTTIAFHAFINRIKKEKKHHETINEYREKVYTELMHEAGEKGGNVYVEPTADDDYED